MSEVTQILLAIEQGDPHAAEKLLPLVYAELRKLAAQKLSQEARGQTLDATALVHEAYVRLVGRETQRPYNDRNHFFAAAATRPCVRRSANYRRNPPSDKPARTEAAGHVSPATKSARKEERNPVLKAPQKAHLSSTDPLKNADVPTKTRCTD